MRDFKKILVYADAMAEAQPAVERAAVLARHVGASLTIVDVADDLPRHAQRLLPEALRTQIARARVERLDALAAAVRQGSARGVEVAVRLLAGKSAIAIIREVLRGGYDVLLKSHEERPGFDAIDMQLLRKCPCPVWLVGPAPRATGRVLAAVDPNPEDAVEQALNRRIVELALYLVETDDRELVILSVWRPYGESLLSPLARKEEIETYVAAARAAAQADLDDFLAPFGRRIDRAIVRLEEGEPGSLIPAIATEDDVDLVVMGSVARTGITGFLMGNTAEQILGVLPCSVLTVKPEGFVSPIAADE